MIDLKVKLDREERSNYTLIIDVSDLGSPQQQTSTVLTVVVEDEDDHVPQFNRQRMQFYILSSFFIDSTLEITAILYEFLQYKLQISNR